MRGLKEKRLHTGSFAHGLVRFRGQIFLQAMVIPAMVFLVIFCYLPMYGIVIAFTNYRISDGFFGGQFVGLQHFVTFFSDKMALQAVWNTLIISVIKLLVNFPAPILFALLLNEVRSTKFKKTVQTISYLPFFLSWVVVASIIKMLFELEGPVNYMLMSLNLIDHKIAWLNLVEFFRPMAVVSDLWKGIGWGSIIYIASIASIPQDMYESAIIDGASRFKRACYITIPSIMPTIVLLFIMSVSGIFGSNFDQHFLMKNPQNLIVSDTIDTYVFSYGISKARYSYATAVGLSRSVIGFFLLFGADRLARWVTHGEHGVF